MLSSVVVESSLGMHLNEGVSVLRMCWGSVVWVVEGSGWELEVMVRGLGVLRVRRWVLRRRG